MRPGGAACVTCTRWTAVQLQWECNNKKGIGAFVNQAVQQRDPHEPTFHGQDRAGLPQRPKCALCSAKHGQAALHT